MNAEHQICFPPFRLDLLNEQLWRDSQEISLRPKTLAVLRYLLEHSGELVTKEALLDAVWAGTTVSDVAPGVCVQELRRALGDDRRTPQFIVTVHRRGYRFIGKVVSSPLPPPASSPQHQAPTLVGRKIELQQLHNWLGKALNGERQLVFVTGEPGIGKTTLIETFVFGVRSHQKVVSCQYSVVSSEREKKQGGKSPALSPAPNTQHPAPVFVAHGQCIEHHGQSEAYLPLLEALGRLCRSVEGEHVIAVLRKHAPMWLVQLPAFIDGPELEALQRKVQGASRERMLRELAETLEVLTAERLLVLILEDLHWSDVSTLDFLAFLARRKEPARLLVIGTYRPVEMLMDGHPLKRMLHDLYAQQRGHELALRHLTEGEIHAYLTVRFPDSVLPTEFGRVLHQRTGGNPLFLTSLVQELGHRGVILQEEDHRWAWHGDMAKLETWMPESVRHVLARQRERLALDEQRILEAASLAGLEFSAAAVAAALETAVIPVEEYCGRLAEQHQFLRLAGVGEWPDGTRAGRYGFLHALYQEFWHERVSAGKQQQWHQRMGERKEVAYGARAAEIATELALHFAEGRDYARAVHYHQQAAERATQRSAYQEAMTLLTKALELLATLPDMPRRTQQELTLQLALNDTLIAVKGYTEPEVAKAVTRARDLCQQVGETPQLVPMLYRLWLFYRNRGELQAARELGEQMLRLAQSSQDRYLLAMAHSALGPTLYARGELPSALTHLEQTITLYDPQTHPRHTAGTADPRVNCLSYAAWTLWLLGYPDQAVDRNHKALALATGLAHPFSLAYALWMAAWVRLFRREAQLAQERAEAAITLSAEQMFPYGVRVGTLIRDLALAEQGQLKDHLTQIHQRFMPFGIALQARACEKAGQVEKGLTLLAEALALVEKTGERCYEAEMYRLKGTLTLQSNVHGPRSTVEAKAEACFHKAIDIAHKQQAKSLELRAVISLSRLWQPQGKQREAHHMLSEIYNWFTEGFDTKDLHEAKRLLAELA